MWHAFIVGFVLKCCYFCCLIKAYAFHQRMSFIRAGTTAVFLTTVSPTPGTWCTYFKNKTKQVTATRDPSEQSCLFVFPIHWEVLTVCVGGKRDGFPWTVALHASLHHRGIRSPPVTNQHHPVNAAQWKHGSVGVRTVLFPRTLRVPRPALPAPRQRL